MTTVQIDIAKLKSALTALTDLADSIDSERARAMTGTPVGLPTLTDGELGKKSRWLRDQEPELQVRHDLAVLLDTGDTGHASYDVALDSLDMAKNLLGQELGEALSEVDHETSEEDIDKLNEILAAQQDDPEVMSETFKTLGPDGTVGVLGTITATMSMGSGDIEKLRDLAENMRTGLATASNSESWQNRPNPYGSSLTYAQMFADDMVRYSTAPMLTDEEQEAFQEKYPNAQGMHGASILTFLMQEKGYSDDFLVSAASTLDQFEQQMHDGDMGDATYWYAHNGYSPLVEKDELGYDDPMAAIMQNFADNPSAGLRFFDSEDRQEFYFNDRDWSEDGFKSISMAAEGITTDADNLAKDPEATTTIASSFFHHIADNDGFNPEDAKDGSPYVAEMLKFYMPAVDQALRNGEQDGDPGSVPFELDNFGKFDHYPELFRGDLDSLMQVAMGTDEGMTSIAEGVGSFQQTQINNAAVSLGLDPDDPGVRTQLRDVLERTSALQGFTEYSVGQVEIDEAESRDQQRQAYIDLVSEAAGLVPLPGAEKIGELGSQALDFGWNKAVELGTDAAGEHFTSEAAEATDKAETRAEQGTDRVKINGFLALVEAGVIPRDEVPDIWFENGSMIDASDIDSSEMSQYTQSAMNGVSEYATNMDLETSYRDSFLRYYQEASE
ncbi:DUF6571 family protein [Aeromicrobium sp.]|uniref:DUF6571 family protein n=1 Tax=Aeromicrobium sp. TaxID=1871063 RepID=UPI002FC67AF1